MKLQPFLGILSLHLTILASTPSNGQSIQLAPGEGQCRKITIKGQRIGPGTKTFIDSNRIGSGTKSGVGKRVIGYIANSNGNSMSKSRKGNGCKRYKRSMGNIPSKHYTHLIYSFLKVSNTFQVQLTNADKNVKKEIIAAKGRNSNVRIMYALGGWNFNNKDETKHIFPTMASTKENRIKFIKSAIKIARDNGFDGLDLDWEYPGDKDTGGTPNDKENHLLLFKEFRMELKSQKKTNFLLSIASHIGEKSKNVNLQELMPYLDFVNIMSYDLHGSWERTPNYNAPLHAPEGKISIDICLQEYYSNLAHDKLNFGIPFYGVTWTIETDTENKQTNIGTESAVKAEEKKDTSTGATQTATENKETNTGTPPIISPNDKSLQKYGKGAPGPCTKSGGTLALFEIMDSLKKNKETMGNKVHPPDESEEFQGTAFILDKNQWTSWDSGKDLQKKIDYAKEKKFGGVFVWSVDQDTKNYGRIRAIRNQWLD